MLILKQTVNFPNCRKKPLLEELLEPGHPRFPKEMSLLATRKVKKPWQNPKGGFSNRFWISKNRYYKIKSKGVQMEQMLLMPNGFFWIFFS